MPETVGALIFASVEAAGVAGASAFGSAAIIGTLTVNTVVGAAALTAASIGLQYALSNPNVPKPENGAQPLKQAVPSRQRGYWINRLSGNYMLFVAGGGDSQDMIAFHSGRIEEVLQVYLHDQNVSLVPAPTDGADCLVQAVGADVFLNCVRIQVFYGSDTQNSNGIINSGNTSGIWTTSFAGKGIACIALVCLRQVDPSTFTKRYPQGLPLPSVVAKCAPIWDPRDLAQSRFDRSTWRASPNPVLQLIDYLTEPDGGMGIDLDHILPPDVLALWMVEANICDVLYQSAGWYQFDNSPENVIGKILSTCDGWLSDAGDGTLSLTVGLYREPTDPAITDEHIIGFSVNYGNADEETVNQLDVTFTDPTLKYVSSQINSVRDETSISETGIVRSKSLDLSWVQSAEQAGRLGQRALLRLNPKMSGTLVTTLYGMRYLGKRWVKIQFPSVAGLENCVVEIQDKANVDALNGRVTFTWSLVDASIATPSAKMDFSMASNSMYLPLIDDM